MYRQTQAKGLVVGGMFDEFVNRVFTGATKPLLVHLVEDPNMPAEDLAEIEKLVRARRRDMEKKKP